MAGICVEERVVDRFRFGGMHVRLEVYRMHRKGAAVFGADAGSRRGYAM
jgi:hypothetical protein